MASIITRDSNVPTGVVMGQEIAGDSFGNAINTSSNMRNYLTGGNEEAIEMESKARVVFADLIVQSSVYDNRVPLNLLPSKKDQITIEHARKTYRYRHVLKLDGSTIGLGFNREKCF
jgi:hypothetical protein